VWWRVPEAERAAYLARIMDGVEGTKQAGAELVGFALNEDDTPNRADFTYLAAWRMRDRAAVEHQDSYFLQSGWTDYFDQVNARGRVITGGQLVRHQMGQAI